MTQNPLIASALLGTARMPDLPPAPDAALEIPWAALRNLDPEDALLQALALTRALHRGGAKLLSAAETMSGGDPETRPHLSVGAVDALMRLLNGEFTEVLPEWLKLASQSGHVLPGRALPELLRAAHRNEGMRASVRQLAGERGIWIGQRYPEFSWIIDSQSVEETSWDDGSPSERVAWLRQIRFQDPVRAREAIVSHWSGEDPAMKEAILRIMLENPDPADEVWLDHHVLTDRRQEIRSLAAACLANFPDSSFRKRTLKRVRDHVRIQRRLLKRVITVDPPDAFDPSWAADGMKEKPPQGTGEKAWWLRQMVALVPLDEWPELLDCTASEVFTFPIDGDWMDALLLGWLDSARRMPDRAMPAQLIPHFAKLPPWPLALPRREAVLMELLDLIPPAGRFELLDLLAKPLEPPVMLELLSRCKEAPAPGTGTASLAVIDAAIPLLFRSLTRPQARALALCIPHEGIQPRLEALSKLPELPTAAEEFASVLEFRRNMISQLQNS